ncbi:hypothetical protein [Paenibacillus sp. OV219]|uniref:hypothetical protein n=1 Tax=Paenibacillus sp. OV219 TaxID=1884377 RepID=UPI0008C97B4E|nr:hypothetical protein [Paenibacillus sp. OV219]SEM86773.1 hypothetical protein SAMN05518847_1011002 [Paenibacillus sp. OV219]
MSDQPIPSVHPYYQHAIEAFKLLPAASDGLIQLQNAFAASNEDFLAIELKHMIARLEEIKVLFSSGPQG